MKNGADQDDYHSNISRIVNYFRRTPGSGVVFCVCNDPNLIHEINIRIINLAADAGLSVSELFLSSENHESFPASVRRAAKRSPDGIIITNLDRTIRESSGQIIQDINFSRELLISLKVPFLFWMSNKNLSIFANKATDLFIRRDRGVFNFSGFQVPLKRPSRLFQNMVHFDFYSEPYRNMSSQIELIEKQIHDAEKRGVDESTIAKELVPDLISAYLISLESSKAYALLIRYGEHYKKTNNPKLIEMTAMVHQHKNDLDKAFKYYMQSKKIREKIGDTPDLAVVYSRLGWIAVKQNQLETAEKWSRKAVQVAEKCGERFSLSGAYASMGLIALELRDFEKAESMMRKSLQISEAYGSIVWIIEKMYMLGRIFHEQREFGKAEAWFEKAVEILEKHETVSGALRGYYYLAGTAQVDGEFEMAEKLYNKVVTAADGSISSVVTAEACYQLGIISRERHAYESTEKWFEKALLLFEEKGEIGGVADTLYEFGLLKKAQGRHVDSGRFFVGAISKFKENNDMNSAATVEQDLAAIFREVPADDVEAFKKMWRKEGGGRFPYS